MCTVAGISALQANQLDNFRTIWTAVPLIMGVRLPTGQTCYKAIVETGALDLLGEVAKSGGNNVPFPDLFLEVFPIVQQGAWAEARAGKAVFPLTGMLPAKYSLFVLQRSRETILHELVRSGSVTDLKTVLEARLLDGDVCNSLGMTPLMVALQRFAGETLESLVRCLLSYGCNPLANDVSMSTAYHYLLKSGKTTSVGCK